MKTVHIFEDAYYLIGNKSVAKCFLFEDDSDCDDFKNRIDKHLKPICEIAAFGFSNDEFQLLVKVKSRDDIEKYFLDRYVNDSENEDEIPETTYIFAQAMANLQSGYAKYFNYKYKRDGGLMCGRYFRELIESEEMLRRKVDEINNLEVLRSRSKIWTFKRKGRMNGFDVRSRDSYRSSYSFYAGKVENVGFEAFMSINKLDLRGQFKNLPPKRLNFNSNHEKLKSLLSFLFLKYKT